MATSPNEPALIQVSDESGVRHVHLMRPDKQNALTAAMMKDIAAAARGAAAAGNTLLAISAPGARNFCAGADLVEFSSGNAGLAAQEEGLHALIHALHDLPLPVLVLARGNALGAGSLLALPPITAHEYTIQRGDVIVYTTSNGAAWKVMCESYRAPGFRFLHNGEDRT